MGAVLARASILGALVFCGPAIAQTAASQAPPQPGIQTASGLLNRNNLTATGATVPRPGAVIKPDPLP